MPKGPCVGCGAADYTLSSGGPSICPSCDCGIPPEVAKLRRENARLRAELAKYDPRERERLMSDIKEKFGLDDNGNPISTPF